MSNDNSKTFLDYAGVETLVGNIKDNFLSNNGENYVGRSNNPGEYREFAIVHSNNGNTYLSMDNTSITLSTVDDSAHPSSTLELSADSEDWTQYAKLGVGYNNITVGEEYVTINGDNVTINGDSITINSDNVTINNDSVAINIDSVAINSDNVTINNDKILTVDNNNVVSNQELTIGNFEIKNDQTYNYTFQGVYGSEARLADDDINIIAEYNQEGPKLKTLYYHDDELDTWCYEFIVTEFSVYDDEYTEAASSIIGLILNIPAAYLDADFNDFPLLEFDTNGNSEDVNIYGITNEDSSDIRGHFIRTAPYSLKHTSKALLNGVPVATLDDIQTVQIDNTLDSSSTNAISNSAVTSVINEIEEVTSTALTDLNNKINDINNNSTIVKGDTDNSAILKNMNNAATADGSVAFGGSSISTIVGHYKLTGPIRTDDGTYVYAVNLSSDSISNIADFLTATIEAESQIYHNSDIRLTDFSAIDQEFTFSNPVDYIYRNRKYIANNIQDKYIPVGYYYTDELIGSNAEASGSTALGSATSKGLLSVAMNSGHSYGCDSVSEGRGGYNTKIGRHFQGEIINPDTDNEEAYAGSYGIGSHTEGNLTITSPLASYGHAEGHSTAVSAFAGHAEGRQTTAAGTGSHAEGNSPTAFGDSAHAEGFSSKEYGSIVYRRTDSPKDDLIGLWTNGFDDPDDVYDLEPKQFLMAYGDYSHAEGNNTLASGVCSHSQGTGSHASGDNSMAAGKNTLASGTNAVAFGENTISEGQGSITMGRGCSSKSAFAFVGGKNSKIDSTSAGSSFVFGENTSASGYQTVAMNKNTTAKGNYSAAFGQGTITNNTCEFACGQYNVSENNTLFSIGDGLSNTDRHNVFEIKKDVVTYINYPNTISVFYEFGDNDGNITIHYLVASYISENKYVVTGTYTDVDEITQLPYTRTENNETVNVGDYIYIDSNGDLRTINNNGIYGNTYGLIENLQLETVNMPAAFINDIRILTEYDYNSIVTTDDLTNYIKETDFVIQRTNDNGIITTTTVGNSAGRNAFAFGEKTSATGRGSITMGSGTSTAGAFTFVGGKNSKITATATGSSFVFGENNEVAGYQSTAFGRNAKVNKNRSFAAGDYVITNNDYEAAFGKYNKSESNTVFSVGNGTSENNRKNVFEVKKTGSVYATSFYETSDERIKIFTKPIETDLDKLSALRKSYFTYVEAPGTTQIGVSAQEVQKLYPEIVTENSNGLLTVDYSKLSVIALNAVDDLHKKNKELEDRLAKLESIVKNML